MSGTTKKQIVSILSVIAAGFVGLIVILLITSAYLSYRKSETIEKLINEYYTKNIVNNQDIVSVSIKDEAFNCFSNRANLLTSIIKCKANDINIEIIGTPLATANSIVITIKTNPFAYSLEDILKNIDAAIRINQINFDKTFIGTPEFVEQEVIDIFNKQIIPQLQNLSIEFDYSHKNFNQANKIVPARIGLMLLNKSAKASGELDVYFQNYKTPKEISIQTPYGNIVKNINQEAFFNKSKFCLEVNNKKDLLNAFYGFYKAQYMLAHNKTKFNEFYLDKRQEELLEQEAFNAQVVNLLTNAVKELELISNSEYMFSENSSALGIFFPFLQGIFEGYTSMCDELSAPKDKAFSLTKMQLELEINPSAIDNIFETLESNFIKE